MSTNKSPIWNYFKICNLDNSKAICQVDNCSEKISHGGKDPADWNTTNMRKHITRKHDEIEKLLQKQAEEGENKQKEDKKQGNLLKMMINTTPLEKYRQEEITHSISLMILKDFQPYSLVEDKGFKSLLNTLEPRYQVPSRTYFSQTSIPKIYQNTKQKIKEFIKSHCFIASCTTDGWETDSGSSFLSLTAHFLDEKFQRQSILLSLIHQQENHTSENILRAIKKSLKEWDLKDSQISCIIHDNAPNMVSAFKNEYSQIFCSVHTVQICLKVSFEGSVQLKIEPNNAINQIVQKVKDIVSYFNKSYTARTLFYANLSNFDEPNNYLVQDCPTRWNSQYLMLQRFISHKSLIDFVLPKTNCKIQSLFEDDWIKIEQLTELLSYVKMFSDQLESDVSSISELQPAIKVLLSKLNKNIYLQEDVEVFKETLIQQIKLRFNEIKANKSYIISTVLDPRFKLKGLLEEDQLSGLKLISKDLLEILLSNENLILEIETNHQLTRRNKKNKQANVFWEDFDEIDSNQLNDQNKDIKERIQTELSIYTSEQRINNDEDPCIFWQCNAKRFPCLSILVRNYLWIPSSSAYSERVFSSAGNIVTTKRTSLLEENIEILCFLKKNQNYI